MSPAPLGILDALGRHAVHPFPARMAPSVALKVLSGLKSGATVLDPMAGSGTVLALARAQGHRAIGFDVDPLAVLIARAWTGSINPVAVWSASRRVLERADYMAKRLSPREAFPKTADSETREFLRYWFDARNRVQLTALARAISCVRNDSVRDILWCAFSRQIITKQSGVSLALDLAHSRPHRAFDRAPQSAFNQFLVTVDKVIQGCVASSQPGLGPRVKVKLGDARGLPVVDSSVDLVFTSPPYLNAIDYLRCSKFSLAWMGYTIRELRIIRGTSIGAEVSIADHEHSELRWLIPGRGKPDSRTQGILRRYVHDMHQSLSEIARVLSADGEAVLVVGENTIRGQYIPTASIIRRLGKRTGLRLIARRVRRLPPSRRYLPPPRGTGSPLDGRMRREVILTFARG